MRGLRTQFLAPLLVVAGCWLAGWLAGWPEVGAFAGLIVAGAMALVLARNARRRLTDVERSLLPDGGTEHLPVYAGVVDEIDRVMRAVERYTVDTSSQLSLDTARIQQQTFLLDQMSDGIMRVDGTGRITYANLAASVMFGGQNPTGRSFIRVTRDHELQQALRRCLETGVEQRDSVEVPGESRLIDASIVRLSTRPPEVLVTLRDITVVSRLQTVRRDFVANVSHELRTPLATMKILTETLMELREGDKDSERFLSKLDGEIDAMTALVRDLLDLSQLENQAGQLTLRPIDGRQLVDDVRLRMLPLAEKQAVDLSLDVGDGDITLDGDERRLHQAVANLVTNAIDHTPPGGSVTLSARRSGEYVSISVRDTGSGISEPDLARIWERFFKTDRSRSSGGTGLGLAIVKHIVQAHGGNVRATSRVGAGSEFVMELPGRSPVSY